MAVGSLVVAIYAAVTANLARQAVGHAAGERNRRRRLVAATLDSCNRLLEELYQERDGGGLIGDHDHRVKAWEAEADQAIGAADETQLSRFHEPLGNLSPIHALEERRRRVQAILDGL